jgi:hypothetical protein
MGDLLDGYVRSYCAIPVPVRLDDPLSGILPIHRCARCQFVFQVRVVEKDNLQLLVLCAKAVGLIMTDVEKCK